MLCEKAFPSGYFKSDPFGTVILEVPPAVPLCVFVSVCFSSTTSSLVLTVQLLLLLARPPGAASKALGLWILAITMQSSVYFLFSFAAIGEE